jgi:AhpD family alkylhydroperoxidase
MKQIIAVAVAHVTQCPYCIRGHTKAALRAGATQGELMEAIWVAAEMRAGGTYAHAALMITEAEKSGERSRASRA